MPERPKLPPDDERWLRVRPENFTLYSSAGKAETTALARELEVFARGHDEIRLRRGGGQREARLSTPVTS